MGGGLIALGRPLDHVARDGAWPSNQAHGLLSTFGVPRGAAREALRRRGDEVCASVAPMRAVLVSLR